MKKTLAIVLCICMAMALFCGCSSTGAQNSDTASVGSGDNASSGDSLSEAEQAIADRKASGTYPTVVMALHNWTAVPAGLERVNAILNTLTEEKIGVTVDLQLMDFASFRQNVPLMLASGEQLDLYEVGGIGFSNAMSNGYMYDMNADDLIKTYGADILNTVDSKYIEAGTVDGSLYALTNVRDIAASYCIVCIASQYLDGIGYDYESKWSDENEESIDATWEELEVIFAQLKEKYPDKAVFSGSTNWLSQGNIYDNIGADWFGVLMDPANSLEVTDIFESDEFKSACEMFYDYNQKGYFPGDVLTSTIGAGAQVAAGTAMIEMSMGKPGYRTQVITECSQNMIPFQVGEDFVKSSAATSVAWCMNQGCADPIAAMQLLNLCYTDEDVANVLCWGEEGKDYVINDKGTIEFPEGVEATSAEYNHGCQWAMPNECISHVWYTNSADLWERTISFNEQAKVSKALGFVWDNSQYSAESSALQNVYDEYFKSLICGAVNPDTAIPEFVEKLKSVGIDEYIAAKQEALNKWAAEKGIS